MLSHAHYDHGNGFPLFFEKNKKASLYIQKSCGENCYATKEGEMEYIGLPEGLLSKYEGRTIQALIGGFHLYNKTEEEVREFAKRVKEANIGYICTGHCTGDEAYDILKETLGESLHHLRTGLTEEFL